MTGRRDEATANLLATMKSVSPALEKLMAERAALRDEIRSKRLALAQAEDQTAALSKIRDIEVPRHIGLCKAVATAAITCALAALTTSLFTDLIEVKTTASLFLSLLIPLWIVDHAERRFGRWHVHLKRSPTFVRA